MPSRIRSTVRRGGRDGQSRSDAETTPGRTQPRTERTRPPGRGDRGLRETRWSQSPSTGARKIGGQPEGFRRDPEKDVESSEGALGEDAARNSKRLNRSEPEGTGRLRANARQPFDGTRVTN